MLSQRPSVRRWVVLVAALLATALTARLGVWQLDRARQKLDLQDRIEARADLPVLLGAELARDDTASPPGSNSGVTTKNPCRASICRLSR